MRGGDNKRRWKTAATWAGEEGTSGSIKGREGAKTTVVARRHPRVFAPRRVNDNNHRHRRIVGPPARRHPMAFFIRPTSAHPVENNILCKWTTRAPRGFFAHLSFLPSTFATLLLPTLHRAASHPFEERLLFLNPPGCFLW